MKAQTVRVPGVVRAAVVVSIVLFTTGCTDTRASEVQTFAPTSAEVVSTAISPGTAKPTTSTSSTTAPSSTTTQGSTTTQALEPGRLEPAAPAPISVRYFDETGSYFSGHGLEYYQELEGPLVEVAELTQYGLAFQRSWEDNVIWIADAPGDEPRQLLVGNETQRLELEGGEQLDFDSERAPLLYYQRHSPGSPETQESSLRSYNPKTGEIRVIALTGGWEWSTRFSYLTGDRALALVDAGQPGMHIVDLVNDRNVLVFDLPPVCPELGGQIYDNATLVGDQILGSRGIFNTHDGVVDQWGFYLLDPETCRETLIESYPWNNGAYYVESFVGSIVNLKTTPDFDGEPLPAISLDLTGSNNSVSAPFPGFQRPGFLS